MTIDEAKALTYRDEIHYGICKKYVGPKGGVTLHSEKWRVNGALKTWKRRPKAFSLPLKTGFRGPFEHLDEHNYIHFHLASECEPKVIEIK